MRVSLREGEWRWTMRLAGTKSKRQEDELGFEVGSEIEPGR